MLTRLAAIYSNDEVLKIATSGNCELFAMSGERNPYKEAKLGVLQEGAWADMLLVDGDPLRDINVLKDYERNFVVIIAEVPIMSLSLQHTKGDQAASHRMLLRPVQYSRDEVVNRLCPYLPCSVFHFNPAVWVRRS